jgi:hypothetical protein
MLTVETGDETCERKAEEYRLQIEEINQELVERLSGERP